jgi:hypothetical protein
VTDTIVSAKEWENSMTKALARRPSFQKVSLRFMAALLIVCDTSKRGADLRCNPARELGLARLGSMDISRMLIPKKMPVKMRVPAVSVQNSALS